MKLVSDEERKRGKREGISNNPVEAIRGRQRMGKQGVIGSGVGLQRSTSQRCRSKKVEV